MISPCRDFLFYGLDDDGEVLSSELLSGRSLYEARRQAERRLADFRRIELWDGVVCVARLRRDDDAAPRTLH